MKQKTFKRIISIILTVFLLVCTSSFALTSASAAQSSSLIKVTDKVGVILSSDNIGENSTDHTFVAVKVMDLYKVGGVDEISYQNKLVSTFATDSDFETLLAGGGFKYDANTGEITLDDEDGTAIASKSGVNENASDAAKLAALLSQYAVKENISGTVIDQLDKSVSLESGYYVIYETSNSKNDGTVATKPILLDLRPTDANGSVVTQRNITLKDATVNVTKSIVKPTTDETENLVKEDTVAVGDVVDFKIETNLPVYEANADETFTEAKFIVQDTFSDGLSLNVADDSSFCKIYVGGQEVDPCASKISDSKSFTLTFKSDYVLAHQGESVVVTYSATVTQEAKYNAAEGNINTATVKYSNNPEIKDDIKTITDTAVVYTYAFDIKKLDGANDTLLAGAKFQLTNNNKIMYFSVKDKYFYHYIGSVTDVADVPEGYTAEIVTSDVDNIHILGLDEGVYTLTETEAPATFAKLASPVTINVEAIKDSDNKLTGAAKISVTNATVITIEDNDSEGDTKNTGSTGASDVNVVIRNYKGISLPETGSVTSIILMVAGAAVIIGGVVYLVLSRKKSEK